MRAPLAARFEQFRKLYPKAVTPNTDPFLRSLETAKGMAASWRAIDRHPAEAFPLVVSVILDAAEKAKFSPHMAAYQQKKTAQREALSNAAALLHDYVKSLHTLDEPKHPRKLDRPIHQARESLAWLKLHLASEAMLLDAAIAREMPASQKRSEAIPVFAVLLCRALHDIIGRPSHRFVAAITTAIFSTDPEISEETVRKAYARERRRTTER